jgi:hypothetical protein
MVSDTSPSPSRSSSYSNDSLNLFCDRVLLIDSKVCFVGIANYLGTLIASSYRHDLIPLLTTEETAHYVLQSVLRSATREDFESKLGRQEYSIGKYRNVIHATVQ